MSEGVQIEEGCGLFGLSCAVGSTAIFAEAEAGLRRLPVGNTNGTSQRSPVLLCYGKKSSKSWQAVGVLLGANTVGEGHHD